MIIVSFLKSLFFFSACTTGYIIGPDSEQSDLIDVDQYQKEVNEDKVKVQVYYECLCGGCRQFHIHALDTTYKKIGSYIDLITYPYGNAQRDGDKIVCQHGEAECYGNKLHACAIDILKDQAQSEFYNTCMMQGQWGGDGSTDMDATKCGELLKVDSKPIMDCAKSKKGEELLDYYGKETEKINTEGVPWVLINGELFDGEFDKFMPKVCKALTNPPPECNQ